MAAYRELIRASFEKQPATTIAEACERIFQLTGLRRGPSQVRKFLKDLGLKFYRVRAIPVPPKKNLAEHVADQAAFLETELKPLLAAAQAGKGHVFFVDAAHFVFGTFLCLPVVVHADLRACGFGTSAVQCLGGVECGDARTDRRD